MSTLDPILQILQRDLLPRPPQLQSEPRAHPGAGPMFVIRRKKSSDTPSMTPVNPQPDCPPLFV